MKMPSCSDYMLSIDTPQLIKAKALSGGHVIKVNDNIVRYVGGFCVVFPFQAIGKKYAVRCWFVNVKDAKERTKLIAEELHKVNLPYFVGFEYIDEGIMTDAGLQPVVLMDWVDAKPLKAYLADNLTDTSSLLCLAENFKQMVNDLHLHGLAHGDLQHGNIMVKDDGSLVLVDYDSMYVPALKGYKDDIKGLEGYQHEARWSNDYMTAKADYFSELIIYTSIKALARFPSLWNDLEIEDTDTLLFTADDLASKGNSSIFTTLESDSGLKKLSRAIKHALQESSLDRLLPLEDAIVSSQERIVEDIAAKWGDNGYVKPVVDYRLLVDSVKVNWDDNGYVETKHDTGKDIEDTIKKW